MSEDKNDLNTSPSMEYVVITPGAAVLSPYPRGLYVGTTGNVTCEDLYGHLVTFTNAQAGSILPIACKRVTSGPAGLVGLL